VGLHKFLAIFTACLVIIIILVAWFLPLDEDFRMENPFWNGLKDLSSDYPVQSLKAITDLPSIPQGITLIVVPYLEFTLEELVQLDRFVSEGGRIILADDYGHGNQVLEYLEIDVRFSGDTLLDPLVNYRSQYLPKIIHFNPDPLMINLKSLGFNHATCLLNTDNASTLALSSSFSFLDQDGNGEFDEGEPAGPLPVIYRQSRGEGELILVADPSLFINSMNPIDENSGFVQNIVDSTTSLYLDQLHLPPSDLHQAKDLLSRGREYLSEPLATAGIIALVVVVALKPIWYRKKEPSEKD